MITLSKRLKTVASLVRGDVHLADVGCDHGYITANLVSSGKVSQAVACDVNEGPLNSCRDLIEELGLTSSVDVRLSDGLKNVNEDECDDVVIAGMGGELIVKILLACPYIIKKHLVLQPMTHPELVRKYLYDNSFVILNDIIVKDGRHYYNILDAVFTDSKKEYSNTDLYLGEISDFSEKDYFNYLINYLENKQKSGKCFYDVIAAIKERL